MNSRFKAVVVAGVALSAGLWLLGARESGERPASRRVESREAPVPATSRATRGASLAPESPPCDLDCIARARKAARDAKVVDALARLERRTGHITREAIEREQEHLGATAQALHARETEMPTIEDEIDESGARWKKLAYADGAVRYALPEEP